MRDLEWLEMCRERLVVVTRWLFVGIVMVCCSSDTEGLYELFGLSLG